MVYFITYRLAHSLPRKKLEIIKQEYHNKIDFIQSLDYKQEIEKAEISNEWKKYFNKIDKLLVTCTSSPQYLQNEMAAQIVADSISFFDGKEYDLICYCIMSNHVHLVIKLRENSRSLDKIMQSIKSFSAIKCNEIFGRKGKFWQHENYDHIIRNESELERIVEYVLSNPVKAGLVNSKNEWKWNYLADIEL